MEAAATLGGGPATPPGSQAGCKQLEACFPEAGWQAMLVTSGGKAPPPLQVEAESSSSCQGMSFVCVYVCVCPPTGTFLLTAQEEFCPQEATGPALVSRPCQPHIPGWAFASYGPSAPATGQQAPTATTLPSQHPCKGLFSLRKGHALFPPSHHGGLTRREKLCVQKRAISLRKHPGTEPSGTTWMANTVV